MIVALSLGTTVSGSCRQETAEVVREVKVEAKWVATAQEHQRRQLTVAPSSPTKVAAGRTLDKKDASVPNIDHNFLIF